MRAGELECLVGMVADVAPKVMVEFGVNQGQTAAAILENVPSLERYIGIDVLPGYKPSKAVQANEVPRKPGKYALGLPKFELLLKPRGSLDISLEGEELPRLDVAFIDGDHGRMAVINDTLLALRRVRTGGLIIWHDYHNLGTVDVRDVLDEWHSIGESIYHVEGTWLAFQQK